MSVTIRGRDVKIGDALYNELNHAWGVVTEMSGNTMVLQHIVDGTPVATIVSQEGYINGIRRVSWNAPIIVDLATSDVSDVQRLVDAYVEEKKKWLAQ